MDKAIEYNFNGFSFQELIKGRDALQILYDYGFYEDTPEMLKEIHAELERRVNACNSGVMANYGQ